MYSVIIADDEPYVIEGLTNSINWEQIDCEIIYTATDGRQAINAILKYKPDIVITDIRMPIYNGIAVMEQISKNLQGTQVIVCSGYSEFEYAKKALSFGAIDYLIKPFSIEEFEATIRKTTNKIDRIREQNKNSTLLRINSKLVSGDISLSIAHSENSSTIIEKLNHPYYLAVAGFSSDKAAQGNPFQDLIIQSKYAAFLYKDYFVYIISADSIKKSDDQRINIDSLINNFSSKWRLKEVSWGISSEFSRSDELELAFEQSIKCMNYAVYHSSSISYFPHLPYDNVLPASPLIMSVIDALMSQNRLEKVTPLFRDFLNRVSTKSTNPQIFKNFIIDYIYKCCYEIDKEYKVKSVDLLDGKYDLNTCTQNPYSLKNIEKFIISLFTDICTLISSSEGNYYEKTISQIKHYILTNLDKDITLTSISSEFYFSPGYLSNYFKEQAGVNISDYIVDSRMEKARSLLVDTNCKIADIAKAVGYSDAGYFCSVFKKQTGTTASHFRKNNRK